MARQIQVSEAAAARRRVYFHCVDATDGITAELGEAGGQPETSIDGAAWVGAASIGVLVAIGNGRYYAEVVVATVNAAGRLIETRYKSANTAETIGDSLEVVNHNPVTTLATAAADVVNIDGDAMRGTDGVSLVVPDVAGVAAGLHGVTDGLIGSLHDFDPGSDEVITNAASRAASKADVSNLDAAVSSRSSHNAAAVVTALMADTGFSVDGTLTVEKTLLVMASVLAGNYEISGDDILVYDLGDAVPLTTLIATITRAAGGRTVVLE